MNQQEIKILNDAKEMMEEARRIITRGQDKDFIVKEISRAIIGGLTPVFDEVNKTTKEAVNQYIAAIREIKLLPPSVTVNPPNVVVPKIDSPKVELPNITIPEIKIPEINISTEKIEAAIKKAFAGIIIKPPSVEVKPAVVNMPSKMEVKGIAGYFKSLAEGFKGLLRVKIEEVDRDNPLTVTLVDKDGKYYNAGGGGVVVSGARGGGTTMAVKPITYNIPMATGGTEYSQVLLAGTKKLDIKLRSLNALLKIAFVSGESGTNYITIPFGASFHLENISLADVTVYFQSPTPAQVCEIICWT